MGKPHCIFFCLIFILALTAYGQNPVVFSVDRSNAAMHDIVTLHGSDFGNDPAAIRVFFGATKAQIKSISNQVIEVRTPSGATFEPIRVTNVNSGHSGTAPGQFFLNYGGETGIASTEFSAQLDFQAQKGLYDLCVCDFNDDGKPDVATASNDANLITVFENTSTPGNITLTARPIQINSPTLHVRCGDLNGDGKPDIVLSQGADGNRIYILKNNGEFSFSLQAITLTDIKVNQVAIADLDLDGRPEIIVTNLGGNTLTILQNGSNLSAISFGTPMNIVIPQTGKLSTDALAIGDLDGDNYPEIVTNKYQIDSESKLFIVRNGGSLNFSDIHEIPVNKAVSDIQLADLNHDSKPDIVIARMTSSDISVYPNASATNLAFGQPLSFITETRPVGMDLSDFDGDGKLDIAVGSLTTSVSVLNNTTSASGPPSFAPVLKLPSTYINRNLRNADLDGDGKPDIVFTSVDDFSGIPVPASKISVLRNLSCMVPSVTPGGSLNICTGTPLRLMATSGGGVEYQWFRQGSATPVKTGTENFLDITSSGVYKVTAVTNSPACSKASNTLEVTVTTPASPLTQPNSDARSNSPVCANNSLALTVNDVGASEYRWRGPHGFSQTTTATTLTRTGFSSDQAGLYIVEILSGSCIARIDSTLVEAMSIPDFTVSFNGSPDFCSGTTRTLSVTPALASGVSYQWHEKARGPIPEADFPDFTTDVSGEFYAVITPDNTGCLPKQTTSVIARALMPPVASFEAPPTACAGGEILFTQQSSGDAGASLVYLWSFDDGSSSTDASPAKTYSQANAFEVNLRVSYPGLESCFATVSRQLNVVSAAKPAINATAMGICPGESVKLSVAGNFVSITWNNGDAASSIDIAAAGDYSVSTVDDKGCTGTDAITITQNPAPVLTVSADRQTIGAGQTAQLQALGADEYTWSPGKTLNDSTFSSPVASPLSTTTYIVTGSMTGGCSGTASITVQVSGEVVSILVPVLFSPNGDAVNETLTIQGIENYPDCSLNIFDKRGGRVYQTTGYQNNWDGTMNGTPVPEGVYYYVFGCPDKKAVTGTVAVIR